MTVKLDIASLERTQKRIEREMKFAASVALNDAAFAIRAELPEQADKVFERGASAFTKRGFRVARRATRDDLSAEVVIAPQQSKYLAIPIFSGTRRVGDYATARTGVIVPGSAARLNKQGNMPRGYIRRMLSRPDVFYAADKRMANGGRLTAVFQRPKRRGRQQLEPLRVLAVFKEKTEYRRQLFDFFGIARDQFTPAMERSLKKSISDIRKFGRVQTKPKAQNAG